MIFWGAQNIAGESSLKIPNSTKAVNASKQIQLLIQHPDAATAPAMGTAALDVVAGAGIGANVAIVEDVQSPRFQRADELFEFPDGPQLSSSRDEFDFYVKAHEEEWTNILKSIEDNLADSTPLPEYITNLNLNIANASMEYVHYRKKDGSYTKRQSKILVFKITWFIVAFRTGASGNSYCRNGDLVLQKFSCSIFVDGLGHVLIEDILIAVLN